MADCEIERRLAESEFLYRSNWTAFASECCCRDREYDDDSDRRGYVELWTCPDISSGGGRVLHKQRERVRELSGECEVSHPPASKPVVCVCHESRLW